MPPPSAAQALAEVWEAAAEGLVCSASGCRLQLMNMPQAEWQAAAATRGRRAFTAGARVSLRGTDTAEICSTFGSVAVNGDLECSFAVAAAKGVSERLRARQGLRHLSLAVTSALDSTSRRQVLKRKEKRAE